MHTDGWKVTYLWREASRNVFSRESRLLLLVCVAVLLATSATLFAAFQWTSFRTALEKSQLNGRNTIVFEGSDANVPTMIARDSCEALNNQPDVVRAGGVSSIGAATFTQLGSAVQVYAVSPSLVPELMRVDVVAGFALGLTTGQHLLLMPDGSTVSAVRGAMLPAGVNLGSAVSVPLAPTERTVEKCVVNLDRFANAATATPRLSSSISTTGGSLTAGSEYAENGDPVASFITRPDRYLPIILGLLCGIVGLGLNRFRSSDIASYRFSGTTRRSMFMILYFEQALLAGCFAVAGALGLLFVSDSFVQPAAQVLWAVAGACAWLIVALANLALSGGDPSALSKDR